MDIKVLESFMTLAELLNFTKASQKLDITQPALSRQITALEDELGCLLFERNKRSVTLTSAGESFLETASRVVGEYETCLGAINELKSKPTEQLNIGFVRDFPDIAFSNLVKAYKQSNPSVLLNFKELSLGEISDALSRRDIDCAITISHDEENLTFASHLLSRHRLCVALYDAHPLAQNKTIHLSDIEDEPLAMIVTSLYGPGFKHIQELCQKAGFNPKITLHANYITSLLMFIQCELAIALISEVTRTMLPSGVKLIPIEDFDADATTVLLWHDANRSKPLQNFIKAAQNLFPIQTAH